MFRRKRKRRIEVVVNADDPEARAPARAGDLYTATKRGDSSP